jgi:hypothetical protein
MLMTTVMIDNNSRIGRRLLKVIGQHPRIARVVDDAFEQDWNQAIFR